MRNKNLRSAKRAKNDEFYTQLRDIENELKHYKSHFRNKVVYCNCNDPRVSDFFHYFSYNFEELGLKKISLLAMKPEIQTFLVYMKNLRGLHILNTREIKMIIEDLMMKK